MCEQVLAEASQQHVANARNLRQYVLGGQTGKIMQAQVHSISHCAANVGQCITRGCVSKGTRGENTSDHCGYPDASNLITHSYKLSWNAETDRSDNKRGGSIL